MAFRALLFSKSQETNAAITTACESTGISAEVCSDIFGAIEKGKTQAFSCVIADWADQPEASFLLKRARESTPNRNTVSIAIVDHDPTPAEMGDNRLDFLIYRPISAVEADSVLEKALEQMQPTNGGEAEESSGKIASGSGERSSSISASANPGSANLSEDQQHNLPAGVSTTTAAGSTGASEGSSETDTNEDEDQPRERSHAGAFRGVLAAALVLTAVFCLWRSREAIEYLSRTPEGAFHVLRESVVALFNVNETVVLPTDTAAQPDPYFTRSPGSNAQTPALRVVATESTLTEARVSLPKASDFPLPAPVFEREHQEAAPAVRERPAIPESMRNSPRIAPPVVVTVNPQMLPVSAPQPQPAPQQFSEPVTVSEEAARSLLVHTVNPVYPAEAVAQKLHGAVVLQALIARDGTVEDLKLVRGYFVLGRAAIAAVKQWQFQPYTINGHAAATQTLITINFSYPPG